MRILVADDSRTMRMIIIRTLRQAGHGGNEILEAEDGAEALKTAQSQALDLILSDWNMPTMSGLECLRALRASGSAVPFCFVTSETSEQMRDIAIGAGAIGLITKPFTAERFNEILGSVVSA